MQQTIPFRQIVVLGVGVAVATMVTLLAFGFVRLGGPTFVYFHNIY